MSSAKINQCSVWRLASRRRVSVAIAHDSADLSRRKDRQQWYGNGGELLRLVLMRDARRTSIRILFEHHSEYDHRQIEEKHGNLLCQINPWFRNDLPSSTMWQETRGLVRKLNRTLRGWTSYFNLGTDLNRGTFSIGCSTPAPILPEP